MKEQVVLTYHDEDLHDNFIVEAKKAKSLSKIIMKCLSAYYYYDDVRELIDYYDDNVLEEQVVEREKFNSELKDVKDSLATLDVYLKDLGNVVGTGIEEFTKYAKQRTELTAGTGADETEYGVSLVKFGDMQEIKKEAELIKDSQNEQRVKELENELSSIKEMIHTFMEQQNENRTLLQKFSEQQAMQQTVQYQEPVTQIQQPVQHVQQPVIMQQPVQQPVVYQQPVQNMPVMQEQQTVQTQPVLQVQQQPVPQVQQQVAQPVQPVQQTVQQVQQPVNEMVQQQPVQAQNMETAPQTGEVKQQERGNSADLLGSLLSSGVGFKF